VNVVAKIGALSYGYTRRIQWMTYHLESETLA
jgi:hypothetical protein